MEQGQIGFRVSADYPCRGVATIAQGYQDFVRIADYVITGEKNERL